MTKKSNDYVALQGFIKNQLKGKNSVTDWNQARELAKEQFSPSLISKLDASGEIKKYV